MGRQTNSVQESIAGGFGANRDRITLAFFIVFIVMFFVVISVWVFPNTIPEQKNQAFIVLLALIAVFGAIATPISLGSKEHRHSPHSRSEAEFEKSAEDLSKSHKKRSAEYAQSQV